MSTDAAQAAINKQLHSTNNNGVHKLLANYVDVKEGHVFRLWDQKWVALKFVNGVSNEAMYFDDKINMKIRSFDGAANVLE